MARKSNITFEMIEPLIVFSEIDGRSLYVEFGLPGTSEVFESKVNIHVPEDLPLSSVKTLKKFSKVVDRHFPYQGQTEKYRVYLRN